MAAALDDPFAIPDAPQSAGPERFTELARVVAELAKVTRRTHVSQRPSNSPTGPSFSVIVDAKLIVADVYDRDTAEALAIVLDRLMPDGVSTEAALEQAMAGLVDLAGARYLIASVLEHAALTQSTEVSPAGALVDAATRVRGTGHVRSTTRESFHGLLVYENGNWKRTEAKGYWVGQGDRRHMADRWLLTNTKATLAPSVHAIVTHLRERSLYPGCERCNKLACMLVCNVTKGTLALPELMHFRVLCGPCHVPGDGVIIAVV